MTKIIYASITLCLAGCAVGPNYKTPDATELDVPAAWHATLPHEGSVAELNQWWNRFDDTALTQLVETAERNSPTVAEAVGKVREARASVTTSRAGFFPSLSGTGSVTRAQEHSEISSGGSESTVTSTTKEASADASWEIDIFGGTRRSLEGSKARLSSAEADWHDARVTLAAEVANAYTTAREYQGLIALYEQELASRQATEHLTSLKVQEGLSPSADSLAIEASSATSAGALESQRGLYAQTINQLVMLTGLSYAEIESILSSGPAAIPQIKTPSGLDIPANVVSQRPDVRSSERLLAAANADIGVAIADRLPSLTLVGSIGINSVRSSGVTTDASTWSFGPSLDVPIFTGGKAAAKVESARALYDQALASYHSSVLTAVQEIENALVRIDTVSRRTAFAEKAEKNYSTYFGAIEKSYNEGKSSLLELETARRDSLASKETLISVRLEQAQSWIALYKAAGGGWETPSTSGSER